MTSPDIIAIVAIVVSAIVSIISVVTTFRVNKANIEAKRSEIAFEKRLDAFREIVEKIGEVRYFLHYSKANLKTDDEMKNFIHEAEEKYRELYRSYQRLRVYFPPAIQDHILDYGNIFSEYFQTRDISKTQSLVTQLHEKEKVTVGNIQKFIGYS